jgi:hypothetical protein
VFSCGDQCPQLKMGDTLLLVAMHIASKQLGAPDWLWATFWWRKDAPSGQWWTCGDAQRSVIGSLPSQWRNYSMDVTKSFKQRKPRLDVSNPCGAPSVINAREHEEDYSSYSPFVEARFENGLKSSCISCHARAGTNSSPIFSVPPPGSSNEATLKEFEGHIGLDYMWIVRRAGMRRTTWTGP